MRIVFAGAGGHGKVCAHIAAQNGYDSIIFLDDGSEPAYTAAGRIADFAEREGLHGHARSVTIRQEQKGE